MNEPRIESQEFKANFVTVCECDGFKATVEFLNNLLLKAEAEGRTYSWIRIVEDYYLPEKIHIDYEFMCPNFNVVKSDQLFDGKIAFDTIASVLIDNTEVQITFARVFQVSGNFNEYEMFLFARSLSYLRFRQRDAMRNADIHYWNSLVKDNIVSCDTVLLFQEDKYVSHLWAKQNFSSGKSHNAWFGKCGEFIFRGWASQLRLSLSFTEINFDGVPDEYDFINTISGFFKVKNSFFMDKKEIKIDVKTFQIEDGYDRDYWTISQRCLVGNHKQDIFAFVIIDEDFRLGKVVGMLTAEEVQKKGILYEFFDEFNYYSNSYYKIKLSDLKNTYYLRAFLDTDGQVLSLMETMGAKNSLINLISNYPLDPILISNDEYNSINYDTHNLVIKPRLLMYIPKNN